MNTDPRPATAAAYLASLNPKAREVLFIDHPNLAEFDYRDPGNPELLRRLEELADAGQIEQIIMSAQRLIRTSDWLGD